jgi:aspartate/tyrosine/aromatic aminotransferase
MSEEKKFLSFDEIIAVADLQYEDVYIEDWDGWVRIQEMDGIGRDQYELHMTNITENAGTPQAKLKTLENVKVILLQICCINPVTGDKLFTKAQIEQFNKLSSKPIDKLFTVARRLNKLTDKDLEEAVGNSENDLSENGGSSSVIGGESQ